MSILTLKETAIKVHQAIFSKNKGAQEELVKRYYNPNAIFCDPLVSVNNTRNILSQYQFITYFSKVQGDINCVLLSTEGTRGFGLTISFRCLSRFEFLNDKIVRHEDIWSPADLISRLPLVGFVYNSFRSGLGWSASKLIQMIEGESQLMEKE